MDFVGYIDGIKTAGGIRWLRVDTLRVNPDIAKKILTKPTTAATTGKAATGGTSAKLRVISESECNITLPNGVRISTPEFRLKKGNFNKQEQGKFEKELRVAKRFAQNGHEIIFTDEPPGIPMHDVLFDGKRADIKSLSSHNNLLREARDASSHQNAEIILIEFTKRNDKIIQTIQRLSREGIHGKYYFPMITLFEISKKRHPHSSYR